MCCVLFLFLDGLLPRDDQRYLTLSISKQLYYLGTTHTLHGEMIDA
jgi:hypothetical protein